MIKKIQRFISVLFAIVIILMISSEVLAVQYDGRIELDKDGYTIQFDDYKENIHHDYQYFNGASVTPQISVVKLSVTGSLTNQTLKAGTDYTVSYSNNVEPGIAKVYATGIGHYCGTLSAQFTISNGNGSGSTPTYYAPQLSITKSGNGTISVSPIKPNKGDWVTITAIPEEGYILDGIRLNGEILQGNHFYMPDNDVIIKVEFKKTNGKCGDNLGWELTNGILTISGSGEMSNWKSEGAPWYSFRKNIRGIKLPAGLLSVGDYAFEDCSDITRITIPNSVTSIGANAFIDCYYLNEITISDNVASIGDGAFSGCSRLSSFTVPNKITSIGADVFSGCSSLSSVSIPTGITQIGDNAFSECSDLSSITIPNNVVSIGKNAFHNCSGLNKITLSDNVTSIGDGAFSGCSKIRIFIIPNKVTSISADLFNGCSWLENVVIPTSVTKIGNNAFKDCPSIKSFTVPDNITQIGNFSFDGCSGLETVTIHANISKIGQRAFYNCSNLTDVYFDGDSTHFKQFTLSEQFKRSVTIHYTYHVVSVSLKSSLTGTVSVSKTPAKKGETITVTYKPYAGYELDSITVDDQKLTDNSFIMPDRDVVVEVTFKKITMTHELTKVAAKAATCTKSGNVVYYVCRDNNCGCNKYYSDKYGQNEISYEDTRISPIPHKLTRIPEVVATCSNEGKIEYWKCTVCNRMFSDSEGTNRIYEKDTIIPKLEHSWDQGEVTKEPTCEEEGIKLFHCTSTGCTETKTVSIKALGHKNVAVAEKTPTKTEPGNIKHYKCERCGKLFSEANGKNEITQAQAVIPATGHNLIEVRAKAATCSEQGNIAYFICKDDDCKCGKAYSDAYGQHEIDIADTVKPALGHNPVETAGKDPTCTEGGYEKYYKCSRCHKLFSDADGKNEIEKPVAISKLGHDMKHFEVQKPTHEDDGHREYYHCNRCGKNFADADGSKALTDAEIVVPHIGAAVLGEEITEGDFKYKITNPKTDGTGTVTIIGVENENESVTIPNTVELKLDTYKVNRIGPNAFYGNMTIKTLSIGSNVVIIDANAFYGCSNLVKVSGGSRLKTIGTNAFARCSKLSSFTITSSVLSKIGPTAFYKDTKLKTIYIKNTTKLTKAGVKKSLKGSSVKTVKVKKSKVKKYKKYFKKKNSGRKVKVKK